MKAVPSREQLVQELEELCRVGYPSGGSNFLPRRVPGLIRLSLIGGPAPPDNGRDASNRREALRSLLKDVIETEVLSTLDDQHRAAALELFLLDKKRPLPPEAHKGFLGTVQKKLNEDFGGKPGGRAFLTHHRPPILEVIADALIEREEAFRRGQAGQSEANDIGELGGKEEQLRATDSSESSPSEEVPQSPPASREASIASLGSSSRPSLPESHRGTADAQASEPAPASPAGPLLWAALCALFAIGLFLITGNPKDNLVSSFNDLKAELGLSDSPTQARTPSAEHPSTSPAPPANKEFGGGEGAKLYEPTCGVLADSEPDPADANPRLAFVDMAIGGRRIRQPPEDYPGGPTFADVVKIRPFEVVQIAALIQNQGPAAVARNVVLRLVFPMHSSTRLSITATAEATNARPAETYRNAGIVSLVSLTGEPLRLENFRNVQVQRNEATRTYRWSRFESFDSCALESKRSDRTFEVAMPSPSIDGSLGVGKDDSYRVVMLADVSPG